MPSDDVPTTYIVYADGGCSPREGAYGSFAIYKLGDNVAVPRTDIEHLELPANSELLVHESKFDVHGVRQTNNVAEITALHMAISWLLNERKPRHQDDVHVYMDSELTLRQVQGLYKVKNPFLLRLHRSFHDMIKAELARSGYDAYKRIRFHWISGVLMKETIIAH